MFTNVLIKHEKFGKFFKNKVNYNNKDDGSQKELINYNTYKLGSGNDIN